MTEKTSELCLTLLQRAYSVGVFPMAESRDDPQVHWVEPKTRGIIPIGGFHISRSLKRAILAQDYNVTLDKAFADVIDACANRPNTWINAPIRAAYLALHERRLAHSLEVWRDQQLIGGVYGVSLGAAFFGESMFSRATNGSKIALAYLLDHVERCGYQIFDTQFPSEHLTSLGGMEIAQEDYVKALRSVLSQKAEFGSVRLATAQELVQRNTQMSMRA